MCACTSLQPIESTGGNGSRISYEEVLNSGDDVRIHTVDGEMYEFRVTAVDSGQIEGGEISISTDEISSVEVRVFSKGRTAALVLSGIVALKAIADYSETASNIGTGL